MISIIICSLKKNLLRDLEKNIEQTIGVPYEIIATDNAIAQSGICKIYNNAAAKARFSFLCFIHEDVLFETTNWGILICQHLSDEATGMVGVAGGDIKSRVPSSWSQPVISTEVNIIQHYKTGNKNPEHILLSNPEVSGSKKQVVLLDGVLLCTKKKIFEQFKFDENIFRGFHGYDIDYSLQVGARYNLYVAFDVLIHHFSEGNPDKQWVNSAIRVSKKWKALLPCSVYRLSKKQYGFHHWHTLRIFLGQLISLKYNFITIFYYYIAYSVTRYFSIRRFLSLGKYILLKTFTSHN